MILKLNRNNHTNFRVCAFDPGGTIGFAIAEVRHINYQLWGVEITTKSIAYPTECKLIEVGDCDYILVEDWILHNNSLIGRELVGSEAKGYIIGRIWVGGVQEKLRLQPPSVAGMFSNKILKDKLDVYPSTVHERDAIRHILYFLSGECE